MFKRRRQKYWCKGKAKKPHSFCELPCRTSTCLLGPEEVEPTRLVPIAELLAEFLRQRTSLWTDFMPMPRPETPSTALGKTKDLIKHGCERIEQTIKASGSRLCFYAERVAFLMDRSKNPDNSPQPPTPTDNINLGPSANPNAKPTDFDFLKVIGKGSFGKVSGCSLGSIIFLKASLHGLLFPLAELVSTSSGVGFMYPSLSSPSPVLKRAWEQRGMEEGEWYLTTPKVVGGRV
ncbi:dysbindin [Platysternon megacephalum]|uniref:Dysbindin n=1 Tax=Platysternon megacephalum TaxID=55544 RepID=A0A4D9EES6_9SAUR|nr:dysbindin [Platysternon megacephalum]